MIIRHSASAIGEAELTFVRQALEANFVGYGPITQKLEETFRQRTDRLYAYAVASGSIALLLALKALDMPIGSAVALPVLTCASVLNAVYMAGYSPQLVDIRQEDLCLDIQKIPAGIRAIIAPHAYGAPLNVEAISALNIPWIEDCATSPATQWRGRLAGTSGTLAIFSLGSTKYITGGMGGVLVTSNQHLAKRIDDLLNYDKAPSTDIWTNQHPSFTSARLSDVNAAIALCQLELLESFLAHRVQIAQVYGHYLRSEKNISHLPNDIIGHTYYRYIIRTHIPSVSIIPRLHAHGIMASASVNPWLDEFVPSTQFFSSANLWRHHLISLPIHLQMTQENALDIAKKLRSILKELEE